MTNKQTTVYGFTLLEVLVAMAIFTIIGLSAYQMLRTIIDTHDRTQEKIQKMTAIARASAMMQRDFGHIVMRSIRDEFGDPLPPVLVGQRNYAIELSRTGWNNPLGLPRSNIQRIAYALNDKGELNRYYWSVLDRAEDSEPLQQTLLTQVVDLRFNLLVPDEQRINSVSNTSKESQWPIAVEVLIETEHYGQIRRLFNLVSDPDLKQLELGQQVTGGNGRSTHGAVDVGTGSGGKRG